MSKPPKKKALSPEEKLKRIVLEVRTLNDKAYEIYREEVQRLADKHKVHLATGWCSTSWQVRVFRGRIWRDQRDEPVHPIFAELEALETLGEDLDIGPGNMEEIHPRV